MTKKKPPRDTVNLSLELLRRIPRLRKTTAQALQQDLADAGILRTERTIQRQLDTLSDEFGLERDISSKPYGYCWPQYAKGLSIPSLSLQESLLLNLAHEQLRYLLPPSLMRSMEGFFKQATLTLLGSQSPSLERQWPKKIRVVSETQPLLPAKINQDAFDTVSEALYKNRWLSLDYRNARQKQQKSQHVMPLGLAQQGARLYLVCRYRGYDNERSLFMNRIQAATMLTQEFDYPQGFDLRHYDEDGRFGFGEGERTRLVFHITKAAGYHLLETPISKDQTVSEEPDYYRIEATIVQSKMLERWLRGFGKDVSHVIYSPVASAPGLS